MAVPGPGRQSCAVGPGGSAGGGGEKGGGGHGAEGAAFSSCVLVRACRA